MEVISCHDCHGFVSFSATRCPHYGSTAPSGPYQFSKEEVRKFRIEQRNDNYLIRTAVLLGVIGMLYGIVVGRKSVTESSWYGVQSAVIVVSAAWYGLMGALIGVPLAATVNLYRSARHFLISVVLVVLFLAYEFGFLRLR
jgi:membrane associated rhomboid family serine protease